MTPKDQLILTNKAYAMYTRKLEQAKARLVKYQDRMPQSRIKEEKNLIREYESKLVQIEAKNA